MTIESILSKINAEDTIVLESESHRSLEVFPSSTKVFYIDTIYNEISNDINANFIIFSAPGASGKSALARHIAQKYKGIYWNLANIGIGENTFYGTLWRALRQDGFMEYTERLKCGKSVLVIDAFDEAEMISGRTGIEYFLNDLKDALAGSMYPSVILLARTETASFLAGYCAKNNIRYSQYEIGFFTETNARFFIEQSYLQHNDTERKHQLTPAISKAIEAFFNLIKNVLDDIELYESFIGYAPILQAIERTIEEESNTAKLLSKIVRTEGISEQLIYRILEELLYREQQKVINALKQKWEKKDITSIVWDDVYTIQEQTVRILEYVIIGEIPRESYYDILSVPDFLIDEYLDVILPFIGQHPFIQYFATKQTVDFTGPAFRDFSIAHVLCSDYDFLAKEFISNNQFPSHHPSQLLFDFYRYISNSYINNEVFPVLYDSFKAKEKKGFKAITSIIGNSDELIASFSLVNDNNEENCETVYFNYADQVEVLSIERISDGTIDFDGTVEIKGINNGSRISDTSILAEKLTLNTDRIELEVGEKGQLYLSSKQDVTSSQQVVIDIRKAESGTIVVDFPNVRNYYKLIPYAGLICGSEDIRYIEFRRFFIKVLNSMRAHSKDTPAKDKEKIDFLFIGSNHFRKAEMEYLISKGIFFVDKAPSQSHLYKLNKEVLSQHSINWVMVNKGEDGKMKELFKEFIADNPNIGLT